MDLDQPSAGTQLHGLHGITVDLPEGPCTMVPCKPSERFPCLVDLMHVRAVDEIMANHITCIPLQNVFLHLVASIDLLSRNVYSLKPYNKLNTKFFLNVLEMTLEGNSYL
jgi:putative transposase